MSGRHGQDGAITLEAVLVAPVVALLVVGVLGLTAVTADQLVAERTARAAARAVALTGGPGAVTAALPPDTTVTIARRGRAATVTVAVTGDVVGIAYRVVATATAPLEPVVP